MTSPYLLKEKHSKTFARHMATLATGVIDESFIRGVRKALHASDRREHGYFVGQCSSKMTGEEIQQLLAEIIVRRPRVEAKQSEKGLVWLRSRAVQRELGAREKAIVADFDHFSLSDFYDAGEGRAAFFVPRYIVYARDGRSFTYYAGSRQSGIPLTVVG